jgi:quercetin dioxygenase-like cupin family protein
MKFVELKDAPSRPNPYGVDARKLSDTENALVLHVTVKPGVPMKEHITPADVAFYVLEGQGVVQIGEEKQIVKENTLIQSPAGIPHRWINESNDEIKILVVKYKNSGLKEATKIA